MATVSRIVIEEGGKSLRLVQSPLLTECMRERHLERCRRLINGLKSHGNQIVIYSDEKPSPWTCVRAPLRFDDQAPGLRDDARRRSFKWREDTTCVVQVQLQAHYDRLQFWLRKSCRGRGGS